MCFEIINVNHILKRSIGSYTVYNTNDLFLFKLKVHLAVLLLALTSMFTMDTTMVLVAVLPSIDVDQQDRF